MQKFKQFWKENGVIIGGFLWIFLLSFGLFALLEYKSIYVRLSPIVVFIIYTLIGCKRLKKTYDKEQQEEAVVKKKILEDLKIKYESNIELINNEVQEAISEAQKEYPYTFEVDSSLEYLLYFEKIQDWLCENDIAGKPDSFIIASSLMYSILKYPIILIKEKEGNEELILLERRINLSMAMNIVLEMISELSTYYFRGVWKEEKHTKVNIVIPAGIIEESKLYDRIMYVLYWDELEDMRTSIIQLSNILHLIYISCK